MALVLIPCTIRNAKAYTRKHHRHCKPPQGAFFAVGCAMRGKTGGIVGLSGVAIVGRPIARRLVDGFTAEITRVTTDLTKNACSFLYGACCRAARNLGYRKVITYTRKNESGTSLRAAGFRPVAEVKPESWNRPSRHRHDDAEIEGKIRWEITFADGRALPAQPDQQ